jgi:hypothetical protein
MPQFFFDVFDGERVWTDEEGTEHPDLTAARQEAVDTITGISREVFPLNGAGSLSVDIRADDGAAVERVIVTLSFQKL